MCPTHSLRPGVMPTHASLFFSRSPSEKARSFIHRLQAMVAIRPIRPIRPRSDRNRNQDRNRFLFWSAPEPLSTAQTSLPRCVSTAIMRLRYPVSHGPITSRLHSIPIPIPTPTPSLFRHSPPLRLCASPPRPDPESLPQRTRWRVRPGRGAGLVPCPDPTLFLRGVGILCLLSKAVAEIPSPCYPSSAPLRESSPSGSGESRSVPIALSDGLYLLGRIGFPIRFRYRYRPRPRFFFLSPRPPSPRLPLSVHSGPPGARRRDPIDL
jgi:hypothetical protein